jgi:hypothetical protein
MPGKTNKKPGDGEEELGDDVLSALGDVDEEVTNDDELDETVTEEFEEDF